MDTKLDIPNGINWEQRKWDAAVAAMQGMLANPTFPKYSKEGYYKENIVENALAYADTLVKEYIKRGDSIVGISSIKAIQIGNQVWSDLLDIDVPGSVKVGGIRYYTWKQALRAAEEFAKIYGKEWRLPSIEDLKKVVREANYNPNKLIDLGFIKAGYFIGGLAHDMGNGGYYWSSTWNTVGYTYGLYFNNDNVWLENKFPTYNSRTVRCVKDKDC